MAKKTVVIVESPAKCKTVKKHMGGNITVLASCGHVRDLIPKNGAVEIDNNFKMNYQTLEQSDKYLKAIAKAVATADTLLLATDPDREGEAIAWHVHEWLKESKKLPENISVKRVVFNQITKAAITEAVHNPRDLSLDLINAQQARRALDYLVGFNLSPLLWKKIRRGLSAGRVQSPALQMIVQRELAIEAFESEEYWSIHGHFKHDNVNFKTNLEIYQGEKQKQFSITTEKQAQLVKDDILNKSAKTGEVIDVKKSVRKRNPSPPFMTSTLQQEASRKLGFNATRTMRAAQQLYEGIDIGSDTIGLITYMRTDSVNLANEAITEIRQVIEEKYGSSHLPSNPVTYKSKSKNAQEAHEAIRPTSASRTPDMVKSLLEPDLFKLYNLIWQRTVACQMLYAEYNVLTVLIDCKVATFKANGSTLKSPGFTSVYTESKDDQKTDENAEKMLPNLSVKDKLDLTEIENVQHFTEPPPRYSEASLVKALEEHGIGRPSTYAAIIATLKAREYVIIDKKRFHPTDVGRVVAEFLRNHFTKYVSYDFTADLENKLDSIASADIDWIPVMREFWEPFNQNILKIDETVSRQEVTQKDLDEKCPECDAKLSVRLGRKGSFVGCSNYPECKYTRNIDSESEPEEPMPKVDYPCPECDSELIYRKGRYGDFIGCSSYPKCKYIESKNQPKDTNVSCPKCKNGSIVEKKTRRGKIFYACNQYPKCKNALWNMPLATECPKCKWPITVLKITKKSGNQRACPEENCDFVEDYTLN